MQEIYYINLNNGNIMDRVNEMESIPTKKKMALFEK